MLRSLGTDLSVMLCVETDPVLVREHHAGSAVSVMEDIFWAAREGNEMEVVRLLDADPTLLESTDERRRRPLAVAAMGGHLGMVRLLIERGADINATAAGGRTALHWAVDRGCEHVVALLLSKGAQANIRGEHGTTPLMWAAYKGHLGVVRMLVQHMGGARLDEMSYSGWTALHWAAHRGHEEVLRYLLLAGCDPTITDDHGRTPRGVAQGRRHSICVAGVRGTSTHVMHAPSASLYPFAHVYLITRHSMSSPQPPQAEDSHRLP
jgi:ankyrin repeat protein